MTAILTLVELEQEVTIQDDKEIAIQFSEDGAPIPSPSEIKLL